MQNRYIVFLVFFIFFVISFLTNILGPIIPDLIESFDLSLSLAGFLPFSFFVAYGIASIPAGVLVERLGEKTMMLFAFFLAFLGAFIFALFPIFQVALPSLFLIGVGMAMLQVVINPLLRTAGGEANFAFNSVAAQFFFGAASFLSPILYSYLVGNVHNSRVDSSTLVNLLNKVVPEGLNWTSLYWVFAAISLVVLVLLVFIKLPKVVLNLEEKIELGGTFKQLLSMRVVWLYFIGMFCYVGIEQGITNWISKFLQDYHGVDPTTLGATAVSWYWGLMTIGCLLGLVLLKLFDSKLVLRAFGMAAVTCLLLAIFGPKQISVWSFSAIGFCLSVMYSIIISLGLNSINSHHGTFAGILCTGISGGAVLPLIVGALGQWLGLKVGLLFLLIPLGYIISISFWAKPLVKNSTLR